MSAPPPPTAESDAGSFAQSTPTPTPTPTPTNVQDGYTEYDSSKSKRKKTATRSKAWDEMEKIVDPDTKAIKAKCKYCGGLFAGESESGTSHLLRHIKSCLKRPNQDIRQYTLKTEPNSAVKVHKFDSEESRRSLITYLVCGKVPFSMVENPSFRYFMSVNCPQFRNISRHTARRDLFTYYTKERELVKEELAKAPGRICLTSDNWTSTHTRDEYICITTHWIDCDWKLQKRIIRFRALNPPFDGLSIADEIALCMAQWNIDQKLFSITLDNASYNDNMVRSLKIRYLAKRFLLCDGQFFQVRCCALILNLIVHAGLDLLKDVLSCISDGIKYIKKSVSRQKKIYEFAEKNFQLNTNKKLRLDVAIRWNSTYLMLEHAIYYKNVLEHWGQRDKNFKYLPSEVEWDKLIMLHKFLKVFYEVTCLFSASNHPTANIYFRGVWRIHSRLLEASRAPYTFMTDMVLEMQAKFDKYWDEYSLILSCAAVLDPRYKLTYVTFCFTKIYGHNAQEHVDKIVNTLHELFSEYKKTNASSSSQCPIDSTRVSLGGEIDDEDADSYAYQQFLSGLSRPQAERSQLDLYLEEESLDLNNDIVILDYWSKSSMRFPELAAMARDLLSISVSTVASESTFSIGKKVVNPWRSSLKSKTVQALVCYEDWMRARGFFKGVSGILSISDGASNTLEEDSSDHDEDDNDGSDVDGDIC